jgi:hypothetical protein
MSGSKKEIKKRIKYTVNAISNVPLLNTIVKYIRDKDEEPTYDNTSDAELSMKDIVNKYKDTHTNELIYTILTRIYELENPPVDKNSQRGGRRRKTSKSNKGRKSRKSRKSRRRS